MKSRNSEPIIFNFRLQLTHLLAFIMSEEVEEEAFTVIGLKILRHISHVPGIQNYYNSLSKVIDEYACISWVKTAIIF